MQTGPMELDPALLRTAETVSHLAIELAKLASAENETPDVDGALPDAWRLLRRACLEIETEGRKRTIEDYKRFRIRPPKDLVEVSKPPPPPPHRERFDTLFHKDKATVFLPSKAVGGVDGSFEWRQLTPWDATIQHASEESKYRPYQIAWAVIDSRVRRRIDEIVHRVSLDEQLCSGLDWARDWDEMPFWMAQHIDQATGIFRSWVNREEWESLAKCANELPRPHNRAVQLGYSFNYPNEPVEPRLLLRPDLDKGLPGPTPPDGTTTTELYQQVKTWAEAVLEAWKIELVQLEFNAFWADGKEHGFLWADVMEMALHTKKHKGGIKWHTGSDPKIPNEEC